MKDKLGLVFHSIIPNINESLKKYLYEKSQTYIESESILFYRLAPLLLLKIIPNECFDELLDENDNNYSFVLDRSTLNTDDKYYNEKHMILLLIDHIFTEMEIKEV